VKASLNKEGVVTYQDPHGHTDHSHEPEPREPGSGWTSYAVVKYGFILILVIVILFLFFVAQYVLPMFD
jgi:hypothetical protein